MNRNHKISIRNRAVRPTEYQSAYPDSKWMKTLPAGLLKATDIKTIYELKRKYPQTIVLLRVEDHYVSIGEDAVIVSNLTGLEIFRRGALAVCYFNIYHWDGYLSRFVKAGHRVALCSRL